MPVYGVNREVGQLGCIGIGFPAYSLQVAQFGGVARVATLSTDQPLNATPVKITGFNAFSPSGAPADLAWVRPEGITVADDFDSVTIQDQGIYLANMTLNLQLSTGAGYLFEFYINGTASGIRAIVDLSNQSAALSLSTVGLVSLRAGDVVALYGSVPTAGPKSLILIPPSSWSVVRVR